jgi:hypothetical protein
VRDDYLRGRSVLSTVKEILELEVDDPLEIELSDLYAANGKYTPEQKVAAVMSFVVTGTSKKASSNLKRQEGISIPHETIRWWKNSSTWWPDVYGECKKKKQHELDASFTDFIHTAIEAVTDRVQKGDWTLDKDGNAVRLPMKGKDAAWCLGIFFDKRQMLRGDPTSRIEKVSEIDRLDSLEKSFNKMTSEVQNWNDNSIEVVPEEKN